jgi:hypothetical protein
MEAVRIMDFQARAQRPSVAQHKALVDRYLRRHDRINNWTQPMASNRAFAWPTHLCFHFSVKGETHVSEVRDREGFG